MKVGGVLSGSLLPMFNHDSTVGVELELVGDHIEDLSHLRPVHYLVRCNDPMPHGIGCTPSEGVAVHVLNIRRRASQERDCLVVVAILQMPDHAVGCPILSGCAAP